jgi:tetratricopeptide (TPR) repeat protein
MNKLDYEKLDKYFQCNDLRGGEVFLTGLLEEATTKRDLPTMLATINELGGIFRVTGRLDKAEKLYLVGLELVAALRLEQTAAHGTTLLNYAGVLAELKQYQKALDLYRQTEAIYDSLEIRDGYQRAALSNNISHMLSKLGRAGESTRYAEESLKTVCSLQGHDIEKATSYATLAARQMEAGRYGNALENLLESERIFVSAQGQRHPHYAGTLNSLGDLYAIQGKQSEAEAAYTKALNILEESQGKNQAHAKIEMNLRILKELEKNRQPVKKKGIELSRDFYDNHGRKLIREEFPDIEQYMAIGLVGEGSECFEYDDDISHTHDFGPGFCIWLPEEVFARRGGQLQQAYVRWSNSLPNKRNETQEGKGRVGVHAIPAFYRHYIGVSGAPECNIDWLRAPESSYATISNGAVFIDNYGEFSRIRDKILAFYPQDVLLKKIAARFALMSQTGQYNYKRCMARNDLPAAYLTAGEFVKTAASLVFLLNRRYMPFYKWTFHAMKTIPQADGIRLLLEAIMKLPDTQEICSEKLNKIEEVCRLCLAAANRAGWTQSDDPFLNNHCKDLMLRIKDPAIKQLPVMYDIK